MKKYIMGGIIGAALMIGGVAIADYSDMSLVDHVDVGSFGIIYKTYDKTTNVVCYSFKEGYAGGISCLKNN